MTNSDIRIELYKPLASYMAGESVEGRVVVAFANPKKFREIKILLDGWGKVSWHEWEVYTVNVRKFVNGQYETVQQQRMRRVKVSKKETYIRNWITLNGDGEHYQTYEPGVYNFEFKFDLSENLPSSFANKFGVVMYTLRAEMRKEKAASKMDKRACLEFNVNGIFDLNTKPSAKLPVDCSQIKGQNLLLFRKGITSFTLEVPERSGFVPGEDLHFEVEFSNESNKDIVKTKAWLQQDIRFLAQNKSRDESVIVASVDGPAVKRGGQEFWRCAIPIPPLLPSTNLGGNCGIIRVEYFLHVKMEVEGILSKAKTDKVPIVIGTIPLRPPTVEEELPTVSPTAPAWPSPDDDEDEQPFGAAFNAGDAASKNPDFTQDYPDLPPAPPSYEEALKHETFSGTRESQASIEQPQPSN